MKYPKYLVRANDFMRYIRYKNTNLYWADKDVRGYKPYDHFTFENLTQNYDYFPITEDEIDFYEAKHEEYYDYLGWASRSDGHGGSKGGTFEEFLERKRS